VSNNLHDKKPAELERVMDEIHSRLARAYGLPKGDIAKLAVKRYGGEEMTERTEEVLANARSLLTGGKEDAMDKMIKWEMIRDMRAQRNNPPPQQYPPQQPQPQLQQPTEQKMGPQDLMMYPMLMMMFKSMAGGEDDILKIYKYKMMMGGDDGKGIDFEKLEQMIREERTETDARMQQMMNTILGQQEADKLREQQERWRREMEQRVQNAEYTARHPAEPQQALPTAQEELDRGLDFLGQTKSKMEKFGMVKRPESPEDKKFEIDKMDIGHKQTMETEAVKSLAKSADKLSDTVDHTTNKMIDLVADEQKVRAQQMRLASPEERERLQKKYERLGEEVLEEHEMGIETPSEGSTGESVDFDKEDDLDVEE